MPNKDGLLDPPKQYKLSDSFYDTLGNAFTQIKTEINSCNGWNRPVETVDGCTLDFVSDSLVRFTHSKYVVANQYLINVKERAQASEFLDSMVREVLKRFRKLSGYTLELTKQDEQQDVKAYSKISADRSWVFGGGNRTTPALARYLITTSRIYTAKAPNLDKA